MKKLITLLLVLTGMVSTASAENMYIVGDAPFGGWKTNDGVAMTDNEDGTFTYVYESTSDQTIWFCISSALTENEGQWDVFNSNSYRPSTKGTTFVQFEVISLSSTDGTNSAGMAFKEGVTYTFIFTKATKELVVLSSTIPDLYLRSNLDANSENGWKTWDGAFSDLSDYKFVSNGWDSDAKKLKYTYNVTSSQLASMVASGQTDFYFRVQNDDNNMPQMRPNGDHTFTFADGKYSSGYDGYSNNSNYTGATSKFIVSHSSIKAAEYKVSVYVGCANWGRTYSTSVEIVSMPLTLSAAKGTFSCDRALDFTGKDVSAYMITSASGGVLTLSGAMTKVPANTGLYLEGSAGTLNIPVITTNDASEVITTGNMLKPGTGAAVAEMDGDYTNFILTNQTTSGSAPLKFYKANNNVVPAGKAYLQILSSIAGARESFWFNEDVTAIDALKQVTSTNGEFFNLAGQRVAQPTKGLYIVNGKKVIIK